MDRARPQLRLYFGVFAGLTLAGVLLRTIAMLTVFDAEIGYFDPGILPHLSRILYILVAAGALVWARFLPFDTPATEWRTPLRLPFALLSALSMAVFSVGLLLLRPEILKGGSPVFLALVAFGLLGSLYFFLSLTRQGRYPDGISATLFLPVFWCTAAIAETYSDVYVTINSPVKLALQMGFIGFMLLLVAELRFRVGKPAPRAAAAFLAIGTFFTLNGSIPLLAASGAWGRPLHTLYAVVLLAAGLYGAYHFYCHLTASRSLPAPAAEPEDNAAPSDTD